MFNTPLAELLRPTTIEEVVGQEHLTAPGKVIYNMLAAKRLQSMIFWGSPGTGKTTIATILAQSVGLPFYFLSAVQAGVKDVKDILVRTETEGCVVLFLDEIHRFNKSQQDALLGGVEKGKIILIGATTENPSFEVNSALLSRCQVFTLKSLEAEHLDIIVQRVADYLLKAQQKQLVLKEKNALYLLSGGDVRKLINILELLAADTDASTIEVDDELVQQVVATKMALYDKSGEQHYDIISAFIKSIRGSDPNAAVYWLARMLEGGEDVKFIARRMLILASEDIGNANPTALVLANACFEAVSNIGMPEARIILSQTAIYLAGSPKSNASYTAIDEALALVRKSGDLPIPLHLRNAPTKLMKSLNYGNGYKYAHDFQGNFVLQEFLPDKIAGSVLYNPGSNAREQEIRNYLKSCWGEKYGY
jgi:putative ATPase